MYRDKAENIQCITNKPYSFHPCNMRDNCFNGNILNLCLLMSMGDNKNGIHGKKLNREPTCLLPSIATASNPSKIHIFLILSLSLCVCVCVGVGVCVRVCVLPRGPGVQGALNWPDYFHFFLKGIHPHWPITRILKKVNS